MPFLRKDVINELLSLVSLSHVKCAADAKLLKLLF